MFTLSSSIDLNSSQDSIKLISKAFKDVIHKFYNNNNIKFDIIIYGSTTNHINDIINEVTKDLSKKISINIQNIENIQKWNYKLNKSAVIFTKTQSNLQNLHEKLSFKENDLKFLIYVEEIKTFKQLRNIVEVSNKFEFTRQPDLRTYGLFLVNDRNFVILSAAVIYSKKACGKFTIKLLNYFRKKQQKWNKKLENFEHFSDFHGCMLDFLVFYDNGPHWYLKEFKDYENDLKKLQNDVALKNLNYRGLTNEIIQLASKKFNFTVHYSVRCTNTKINRYQITGMKNYHGRFGTLINLQNVLISDDKKMYKMSETLGTTDFYYLVTLNDLYTNYEKLLMPFDFSTWILLTIVLLLTFGVIFISYLCPRKIQKLVFGEGVQNPAYNALGVIFGIGQLRLPHESVNRMILLIFLWFCLIFRTCYQSMLFEFMTSDMRKPLPASINDLKEMNYTIVVIKNADNNKMYNDEIISNRERSKIIYKTGSEYLAMYKKVLDGKLTSKYAFFTTNFIHSFLNKTFQNTLTIMENKKLTKLTAYSIIESYNNLLLSNFNFIIHQLIPSGITNYLVDHAIWLLQRPFDVEIEDSRRILSMRDLEFGFVLWLASLSLPIICFLCEISILFYRKIKRVLEEIFVKIFIFLALKLMMEKNHAKW